jgi:hypothetical protein
MSLEQHEIDWIEQLAGVKPVGDNVADVIQKSEDEQQLKTLLLQQARDTLESQVGLIKLGEDFKIDLLSDFLKRTFTVATISDDPNEDFDTGHDVKRVAPGGVSPEQYKLLMDAQTVISKETQKLQGAVSPVTQKKLFSDREISDAIWEPLKRRKLIPENAIPDRYSEVTRTFAGASAEYETRLSAFTESLSGSQGILDGLGIAKDVFEAGGAVVSSVIGSLTALKSPLIENPSQVADILKGVQSGIMGTLNTAETLVKAKEQGSLTDPDTILAVVRDVTKFAQNAIGAGFSGGNENEQALGKAISTGVGLTINVVAIGGKVRKGNFEAIIDDLADIVTSSLTIYSSNIKAGGGEDKGTTGTDAGLSYKELGETVGKAIKSAGAILKGIKNPSPETFMAALKEVLQSAVIAGANYVATHINEPKIEKEGTQRDTEAVRQKNPELTQEEFEKKLAEHQKTVESDLSYAKNVIEQQWGDTRDGVKTQFADVDKKIANLMNGSPEAIQKAIEEDPQLQGLAQLVEAQKEKMQEEGLEAFKEDLEADNKSFRDMLNRSETAEEEDDIEQIEAMIMQLKRDQMMVDLAFQLAGMPAQAVAAFLPQATMAVSAIELIKNLSKAAQHLKAFMEWRENVADARSAMSIQVEAMTNRMGLSAGQSGEAAFKALEEAVKLVGSAVSVAGPFAPAGNVIAATMGGVSTLRSLTIKYFREKKLADAWKLFLSARNNTDDRKLLRKAIRTNPTLAKYVIAYGAEIEGNPVARNAMVKCGLNHDVLDSKDANVQKVVSFMEALYPEDPVLLRPLDEPEPWHPGPVEFSSLSVTAFVGSAQTNAKPALKKGDCQVLIVEFSDWERKHKTYLQACKDWENAPPDEEGAATKALKALQQAVVAVEMSVSRVVATLQTLKPLGQNDKPHEQVLAYLLLLKPIGVRLRAKYRREEEALLQMDGALPFKELRFNLDVEELVPTL